MKLRQIMNDFVECNNFEIKIKNNKITIYYYDKIKNFSSTLVIISKEKQDIMITGKNLIIEEMFKEYVTVNGDIIKLEFKRNEK